MLGLVAGSKRRTAWASCAWAADINGVSPNPETWLGSQTARRAFNASILPSSACRIRGSSPHCVMLRPRHTEVGMSGFAIKALIAGASFAWISAMICSRRAGAAGFVLGIRFLALKASPWPWFFLRNKFSAGRRGWENGSLLRTVDLRKLRNCSRALRNKQADSVGRQGPICCGYWQRRQTLDALLQKIASKRH